VSIPDDGDVSACAPSAVPQVLEGLQLPALPPRLVVLPAWMGEGGSRRREMQAGRGESCQVTEGASGGTVVGGRAAGCAAVDTSVSARIGGLATGGDGGGSESAGCGPTVIGAVGSCA